MEEWRSSDVQRGRGGEFVGRVERVERVDFNAEAQGRRVRRAVRTIIYRKGVKPVNVPVNVSVKSSQKGSQKSSQKGSQKSSQKILETLRQNPNMSTTELAEQIGISRRAVAKHVAVLQSFGVLRRIGPDKGGHWEVVDGRQ